MKSRISMLIESTDLKKKTKAKNMFDMARNLR